RAVRHQSCRRPRTAGGRGLRAAHARVRRGLHRRPAHADDGRVRATGFQMIDGRPRAALVVAAIAFLFAVAVGLQIVRDSRCGAPAADVESVLYVRSGEAMSRMALEYKALAADIDWIRAVQHYGGDHRSPEVVQKYRLLYPLLDRTTSLD